MPAGTISTIAGDGTSCADSTSACGDGASATAAQLNFPFGVAVDADGSRLHRGRRQPEGPQGHGRRDQHDRGRRDGLLGPLRRRGLGDLGAVQQPTEPRGGCREARLHLGRLEPQGADDHAGWANRPNRRNGDSVCHLAVLRRWWRGPGRRSQRADGPGGRRAGREPVHRRPGRQPDPLGDRAAGRGHRHAGRAGTPGAPGAPGPGGTDGATGPQGPRGRDARVRCTAGKPRRGRVRVICRVRLVSSSASYRIRARLSREGRTYATGRGAVHGGRTVLRMRRVRAIRPGTYTLSTRVSGRHAISRQRVIVR